MDDIDRVFYKFQKADFKTIMTALPVAVMPTTGLSLTIQLKISDRYEYIVSDYGWNIDAFNEELNIRIKTAIIDYNGSITWT